MASNNQTIRRAKHGAQNPYFMMTRASAQDERLSWEARGILAYLLSKPDDWETRVTDLQQQCGRDKVRGILKELEATGYLEVERLQHADGGKFTANNYLVHETPIVVTPLTEKPSTDEPQTANPPHTYKREEQKTEETEIQEKDGGAATDAPEPSALDKQNALLQATESALKLTGTPYPLIAKYAAFLTATVQGKDTRNRDNGDWYSLQPSAPADAAEIRAFGLWLADMYDGEPLRKPAAITDYLARFRADEDHGLYLKRAGFGMTPPPLEEPPPSEDGEPADAEAIAEVADLFDALVASKSGGKR